MVAIQVIVSFALFAWLVITVIRNVDFQRDRPKPTMVFATLPLAALIVWLFVVIPSFGQVPAGHRGVVTQFGAVTGEVKPEGLYFVTPFVQGVQIMDTQIHAHKAKATAASRDMQDVGTEITLNYRLDPAGVANLWREIGEDYEARIITPSVQEAVKAATAGFDAEELITKRPVVRDEIESMLRDRLAKHHIMLDQLSITEFQFSQAFSNAIEAKQVATQRAIEAENQVREAKAKADAAVAAARGDAEAIRIQAEAIRAQGGAEYVQLQAIRKWNGQLPTWVASGAVPFVNLGGGK